MKEQIVRIRGLDSLLFRDGRPFSNEPGAFSARTLPLPMPGTVAGFLRTWIGNRRRWDWKTDGPQKALAIEVAGPILELDGEPVFRAPADALIYEDEKDKQTKVMCLRPRLAKDNSYTDIPDGMRPVQITEDVKPLEDYRYWKWADLKRWLLHASGDGFAAPDKVLGLPMEERVHVEISASGTSEEGKLFTAQFLAFERHEFEERVHEEWSLLAKVKANDPVVQNLPNLHGVGLFGGESRAAVIEGAEGKWLSCADKFKTDFQSATHVRMVLATPAVFKRGWKPGWLNTNLTGCPPGLTGIQLKLVAACVPRREAVSGWDYQARSPKPVRWLAPAGSVYFFEVQGNAGFPIEQAWLQPVSDEDQDRRDGYGLALWGIWHDMGGES